MGTPGRKRAAATLTAYYILYFEKDNTFDLIERGKLKDLDEEKGTAMAFYDEWVLGEIWKKSKIKII
jgi:hypothetical protein